MTDTRASTAATDNANATRRVRSNVHIVPSGSEWRMKTACGAHCQSFSTQEDAISAGIELAMRNQAELLVHGRDGQIRTRNAFGQAEAPGAGRGSPSLRP